MCFVPFLVESSVNALLGLVTFRMPIAVSFTLGFSISTISTSVITAILLPLADKGYGTNKDIIFTILTSCPFENVLNIICHGICKTVAQEAALSEMGSVKKTANIGLLVGMIILQIVAGILIGILFGVIGGLSLKPLKQKWSPIVKSIYCIVLSTGFVVAST